MPEHPQPPLVVLNLLHRANGIVNPQELVILGQNFGGGALGGEEDGEIFHQVKQAGFVAGALHDGIEGDNALFVLITDFLPLAEVLPGSGNGADAAFTAVGEEDEGVVPEQLGNGGFVV